MELRLLDRRALALRYWLGARARRALAGRAGRPRGAGLALLDPEVLADLQAQPVQTAAARS